MQPKLPEIVARGQRSGRRTAASGRWPIWSLEDQRTLWEQAVAESRAEPPTTANSFLGSFVPLAAERATREQATHTSHSLGGVKRFV